ncbi:50S ribosomal subunit L30 [Lepidopterella palustris CBS 459.81]|uniref:Large ribosomal subunit protein mL46 n=1 Tax=Lepidopterella palustris CBS 459.81 TaxID=1314670 RepID=A0A8E2EGI1_9PEZI|nr:50S ribosomal subunit L30 [Lepidopterella palustris CBS 459.81]
MNAGHRSARHLASRNGASICRSCREKTLSRKPYSTAAAATAADNTAGPASSSHIPPVTATAAQQAYQVRAGVVLSRPPLITRDLHPFEKAFFLYQRRLNERLALPFTRYFYVKKDTPADAEWKRKMKKRLTPARDIGTYNAYGNEGWNDEVLMGAQESEPEWQVERLLEDAEAAVSGGGIGGESGGAKGLQEGGQPAVPEVAAKAVVAEPVERPMPRVTEADKKGDLRSLDRLLQRTLYLLVKNKDGRWMFPDDQIVGKENLHQAAERVLIQAAGINMNTWVVGNAPIGHFSFNFPKPRPGLRQNVEELGGKTFFMKARIMAGQANLAENKLGFTDYKWLAKDEVEKAVTLRYWSNIKNMLAER